MLRYDVAGEFDFHDDFGWLDITHGLTYANAARWHADGPSDPDVLRLALWCVFQAHWTGRHEWHTDGRRGRRRRHRRRRRGVGDALRAAGEALQRQAPSTTRRRRSSSTPTP